MTLKLIIGFLLIFSVLTLNCLPDQFLDLKKNNCLSCSELEFSVQGGRHSLCECQSGYWFVLNEGKCLTQDQINKIYQKSAERSSKPTYDNSKGYFRNLNQVLTIQRPTVKTDNKIEPKKLKPETKSDVKPEVKEPLRQEIKSDAKPEIRPDVKTATESKLPTKPVTESNPVVIQSTSSKPTVFPPQLQKKIEENLRKGK